MQERCSGFGQPQTAKCCDICGDLGYEEALAVCSRCRISCEHGYCMRELCKIVPTDWVCDECRRGDDVQISDEYKKPTSRRQKTVEKALVKPISTEEAALLLDAGRKLHRVVRSESSPRPYVVPSPRASPRPYVVPSPRASEGGKVLPDSKTSQTAQKINRTKGVLMKVGRNAAFLPAAQFIWKGNFKVFGELAPDDFYIVLQAHPPAKANEKAYKFSSQMPPVLRLHLVPRGNIWPQIFQDYTPVLDDIALYFFPLDERFRNKYSSLLRRVEVNDLAMRCHMDSMELLLFSSRLLHWDCQTIETQYFIWGVFRSSRKSPRGATHEKSPRGV